MNVTNPRENDAVVRSPEATNHASYRAYFERFLPGIAGNLLIPDLRGLSAHVEIVVTDSGDAPWELILSNGVLKHIGHDGSAPDCRYVLDVETLLDVVTARVTPQDAFFEMRIDIEGDIERGLELSAVLEMFFERFPHRNGD